MKDHFEGLNGKVIEIEENKVKLKIKAWDY